MVKGFINYKDGRIPFVIENYRMELFTDNDLLKIFSQEYNFKENYILYGQCFFTGIQGQSATFLVDHSMGSTCYLRCYTVNKLGSNSGYNSIGFQSPFLDDIFRYKYEYLELVRNGINLALEPKIVCTIPFSMNSKQYELNYCIGQDHRLGLLEDFDKKGELQSILYTDNIHECYNLSIVLYRFVMFMLSRSDVPFSQINLYKDKMKTGWLYCPTISENIVSEFDVLFSKFDIIKYIPKILNNIAIDSGNKITQSIPLGHLGDSDTLFSPQRFLQQVMSFEYLFNKLEPKKSTDKKIHLKNELKDMFDMFPHLLDNSNLSSDEISEKIKEMRRLITHGYTYYYDFKDNSEIRHIIFILDKLIRNMSLLLAGFSKDEIEKYPNYL